jgi:hypothetical protein
MGRSGLKDAPYLPIRAGVVYAIRARTRAQIESTQIVRPRPHRRAADRWKAHAEPAIWRRSTDQTAATESVIAFAS